jgi:hypothetical protein
MFPDKEHGSQARLPSFVRYRDLVAAGIVGNWPTLLRLIDVEGFPPGIMIGRNTRAWPVDEIESLLASRPIVRKIVPARRRAEVSAASA